MEEERELRGTRGENRQTAVALAGGLRVRLILLYARVAPPGFSPDGAYILSLIDG